MSGNVAAENGASALSGEFARGGLPQVDGLSDEQLRELADECAALLSQRDKVRKREALEQIRALARAHQLEIEVKPPGRVRRKGGDEADAGRGAG
ncbi:hypothetical protein [Arvimicrobium flavum]|uniref:hypothetical protein n=1 Tax=Arvimicrobium flavum TaxID=3393320 RepID=UPI00237B1D63|nr:hypothetical protein [Mesorhizobium shangrilense]